MAFTVADFHDLIALLDKNPDWQRELRRLTLSDELLALPAEFHALAAAEAHVDERLAALLATQERTDQQRRVDAAVAEARFAELRAAAQGLADKLAAAQARSEEQFTELRAADQHLARRLDDLASEFHQIRRHTENRLANLDGAPLEQQFAMRAPAHLGNLGLRGAHVLSAAEWVSKVEAALDAGLLDENDGSEVRNLDSVVQARDAMAKCGWPSNCRSLLTCTM